MYITITKRVMGVSEDSWREGEQLRGGGELFVDGLVLQFVFSAERTRVCPSTSGTRVLNRSSLICQLSLSAKAPRLLSVPPASDSLAVL